MIKGTDIIACKGAEYNGGGWVNITNKFKLNLVQTYRHFKITVVTNSKMDPIGNKL